MSPPLVVTTTLPVVAPAGTVTTILVALQLVTVAAMPLKATVPEVPKFEPVIVTVAPTFADVGEMLLIVGTLAPVTTSDTVFVTVA